MAEAPGRCSQLSGLDDHWDKLPYSQGRHHCRNLSVEDAGGIRLPLTPRPQNIGAFPLYKANAFVAGHPVAGSCCPFPALGVFAIVPKVIYRPAPQVEWCYGRHT